MGKAVQHPRPFAELCHCPPVVFLVEEEAGLLPVLYIHVITHAVLHDLHFRIKGFSDKSLAPSPCPPAPGLLHRCARTRPGYGCRLFAISSFNISTIITLKRSIPRARDSTTSTSANLSTTMPGRKSASPKITRQLEISSITFFRYSHAFCTRIRIKSSSTIRVTVPRHHAYRQF